VAWAAISYAFGFLIVLLHTARLGLPVLELLKPVYVWIGLPLALVAYFANQLVEPVRRRAKAIRQKFTEALGHGVEPHRTLQENADALIEALGLIGPIPRFVTNAYRSVLYRLIAVRSKPPTKTKSVDRILFYTALSLRALDAVRSVANLALYIFAICLLLFTYVWIVYPTIPQSLGGGAPTKVRLILKRNQIPEFLRGSVGMSLTRTLDDSSESFVSDSVTLFYTTADGVYFEDKQGRIILLRKEALIGAIWR
jgi:hypothetical protein